MYHIFKDGSEIGVTERLTMAVKQKNGCVVINQDGNLLAYGGEIYNMAGKPQTDGFEQCLVVWNDDAPAMQKTLDEQKEQIEETENITSDHDEVIANLVEQVINLELGI